MPTSITIESFQSEVQGIFNFLIKLSSEINVHKINTVASLYKDEKKISNLEKNNAILLETIKALEEKVALAIENNNNKFCIISDNKEDNLYLDRLFQSNLD